MVLTMHWLSWLAGPTSNQWSLFTLSAAYMDFKVILSIIMYTSRQLRPSKNLNSAECNGKYIYGPWHSLLMQLLSIWHCSLVCSLPITLLAKEVRIRVASPRSPILTEPVGPVIKMLSHLRSRWTIGGVLVWRKWRPFKICLHQLLRTLGFITLKRFR